MVKHNGELRVGRRGEQKRRWDRENMRVCSCGNRYWRHGTMCQECAARIKRERGEVRFREIQAAWAAGDSLQAIADRHGIARKTVGGMITRLRDKGWDFPLRHGGSFAERRAS